MRTALSWALGTFTAAYVLSVAVHVVPLSAATFEVRKVTDRFVEPFFAQRWSFFAPTPPVVNTDTIARGRFIDEGGRVRTTEWFSVSAYLDGESKQRPLAPSRRYRTAANAERALLGAVVGREAPDQQQFAHNPRGRAEADARQRMVQRRYGDVAVRVATKVLDERRERAEKLLSVQVRVLATPISSFGQRRSPRLPPHYLVWEADWRTTPSSTRLSRP
jgi:hypothetical protein